MLGVILTLGAAVLCGIDLYLKAYIEKHLKAGEEREILGGRIAVRRVHNKGMALGMGKEEPKVVKFCSGIVTGILAICYVLLFRKKGGWVRKKGAALMLAGGVSNCFDRFARTYVVDYFGFRTKWKKITNVTFNLGDIFIVIGSILVIITGVRKK